MEDQHWLEKRFAEDIEKGVCCHNLYIYRDAQKIYESDPLIDFNTALEIASVKRCGCKKEFPSSKDLKSSGIYGDGKINNNEFLNIIDKFYNNGGVL